MSLKAVNHLIESEVLVIGSGLAGSMAAIKCNELGYKVAVANKGPLCGGGATSIIGGKPMNVIFPDDHKEMWMKEFLSAGEDHLDRKWLEIYLDKIYEYAVDLDKLGKEYRENIFPRNPRNRDDGMWRLQFWGNKFPMMVLFHGSAAEAAFRKKIIAQKLSFYPRIDITALLTDGERAAGAMGFDYRTGETYVFKARAVVLACGTIRFAENIANNVGEGITMAYEAGAAIKSLLKSEFTAARTKDKVHLGSLGDPFYSGITFLWGGQIANRMGEAFLLKSLTGARTSQDSSLDSLIYREVAEGRGPVYEDYTKVPPEWQEVLKIVKRPHWKLVKSQLGLDAFKDKIPLEEKWERLTIPSGCMGGGGGVDTDYRHSSSIPGLFAIGDNSWRNAGLQGHFRGSGTGWALLSGSRVHRFVKEYLSSSPQLSITDKEILAQAKERFFRLSAPLTKVKGLSPQELASSLLEYLIPYKEIISSKDSIEKALAEITRLQKEDLSRVRAADYHELKRALDVKSTLLLAEMNLRGALVKEKFKGQPDEKMPKWIMLKNHSGQMQTNHE